MISDDGTKRDVSTIVNRQFFAATYKSLNDPFECSARFSGDNRTIESLQTKISHMTYNAGIFSLCKPLPNEKFPCSETMWAYYADSHKGFCIAYDIDVLNDRMHYDLIDVINVNYQDNSPIVSADDSDDSIREKIFGKKSKHWKKENEIRLVFGNSGLKSIPQDAITAIYFGLNMPLSERNDIINGLNDSGISFFQMETIPNHYKLRATPLMGEIEYRIIKFERKPLVDNYNILYMAEAKDKQSIEEFVTEFRKTLTRPSNITVVDDSRACDLLDKFGRTDEEEAFVSKHWLAYSTFDAPEFVWYHPE